ncbi:peptidoglycan-associated lipoprotein Pal [Pseudoruegeria sp. SHC-113]|uniref:peptidoglycan-associated lipoprotein Pal n=1 Tax=Pseudoruegeria sp. SHC-113 TaxID=2855439 RepID=UPI0021BA4549|nr:peptidoglycan-associated lipoprotein Pal [Pseudoruegeria sp. SHC-113]MCT8160979.1 peptidoglycan-associated lipoprotein Pal [Pseudoruegeria sp. SHC-113]
MKHFTKAILLLAALGVSACSNDRFGSGGGADGINPADYGLNGGGVGVGELSDPTSIAYFQQAVGDRILFDVDQSSLNDVARNTLNAQANWLQQNPQYTAVIEGHADEQGTREYNLALGARRANAVNEYLVSRGISASRLKTVTYGKERPLEICSEESCYAQNRRAVTVLAAGGLTS